MYRVVLVDDERLIVRGLSSVVPWAELGCEVAGTAYDGVTGMKLIHEVEPDMVITDIRMPNMDGLTMLAALKSEYPRMQMSVLTAYRDFEYARKALNLGVCRYLLKPSNMDEVIEAVRVMAEKLGAQKEDVSPEESESAEAGSFLVESLYELDDRVMLFCFPHDALDRAVGKAVLDKEFLDVTAGGESFAYCVAAFDDRAVFFIDHL